MNDTLNNSYAVMAPSVAKKLKYWQMRTIITSIIGYAMFCFVRKNLSVAMTAMKMDLGITKTKLGLFLTLHWLIYGVSTFANGFIGSRVNTRYFMVVGLILLAACNIVFGFTSAVLLFGVVWVLNGWFLGMGFSPNAHLLTYWIPPKEFATKMSIWMIAVFEISGIAGMHTTGWATDRFFIGRSPRIGLIFWALATFFTFLFWRLAAPPTWIATLILMAAGFYIYGPLALIRIITVNLATKRVTVTALGFTGLFEYARTLASGWGLGYLVSQLRWNSAFGVLIVIGITGTLTFLLA